MLPEFLFTVGNSMQEIARDDFNLLNGANSDCSNKDMCVAVQSLTSPPPTVPPIAIVTHQQLPSTVEHGNSIDGVVTTSSPSTLPLNGIKLKDTSSLDLFPSHPTTWQQHPMNSHEHAHHRLVPSNHHLQSVSHYQHSNQHQYHYQRQHLHDQQKHHRSHHQNRLDVATSKLLLQNSDDPLICRGANIVTTEDDHPLRAVMEAQAVHEPHNPTATDHHIPTSTIVSSPAVLHKPPTTHAASAHIKRPQNGCSSLTKQQLKVKAGLMSAQSQAANQCNANPQQLPANAATTTTTKATPTVPATNVSTTAMSAVTNRSRAAKSTKKKGALKLRFHHQALPPEYLSHYEATQGQLAQRPKETKPKTTESLNPIKSVHTAKLPPPKSTHENVRSWLQKIAEIQRTAQQQQQQQRQQQPPDKIVAGTPQKQEKQQQKCRIDNAATHNDANNNHLHSRIQASSALTAPSAAPMGTGASVTHTQRLTSSKSLQLIPRAAVAQQLSSSPASPLPAAAARATPLVHHNGNGSTSAPLSSFRRVINYADLPYMGEITLDNSKPRRGRKPKKTDICHLIYKNYGTIFPGTPKDVLGAQQVAVASADMKPQLAATVKLLIEQPLNLCLRDQLSDLYSISSEEDDNGPASDGNSACNDPIVTGSALDAEMDILLAANMENSLLSLQSVESLPKLIRKPGHIKEPAEPMTTVSDSAGYTAESLLHPVSVYYQKLLESGKLTQQHVQPFGLPVETIQKDNQLTLKIPIPSGLLNTPKMEKLSPPLLVSNIIEYPDPMSTPSSIKSEHSHATSATSTSNVVASVTGTHQQAPQKRKRSAIFIPPIPAENTTNPATEVSICKFKFTGGAKPTLQEKKMLSVDSDGNYRYYSGTGDKSTRGYEFFPRESLQQSAGLLPGVNCTNVCSQSAERDPTSNDILPPSAGLSNELLQIPESPTGTLLLPASADGPTPTSPNQPSGSLPTYSAAQMLTTQQSQSARTAAYVNRNSKQNGDEPWHITNKDTSQSPHNATELTAADTASSCSSTQRRRGTRRTSQREKLEKTFKEKGFLIQTQQLESAEGATYCKFRQLKKFTRYLFRNWKGYLPDELQQQQQLQQQSMTATMHTKRQMTDADGPSSDHQLTIESILARHGFVGGNGAHALKEMRPKSPSPQRVENENENGHINETIKTIKNEG